MKIKKCYKKGILSLEEAILLDLITKGKVTQEDYESSKEELGHPDFIKFNKRYKTLLNYWKNGGCTMQNVLDAIEILEKYEEII